MATVKFSSKIDKAVLDALRLYAAHSKRAISDVLTEAVAAHLQTVALRPAFRSAATEVLDEHAELLERLAK